MVGSLSLNIKSVYSYGSVHITLLWCRNSIISPSVSFCETNPGVPS